MDASTRKSGSSETAGSAFRDACLKIRDYVAMEGSPVAVTYQDELPEGQFSTDASVVCQAMQDARFGVAVALCHESSTCPGANYLLGLNGPAEADIVRFLVDIEKSYANRCVALCAMSARPPPPIAKYVTLSPLERCSGRPDLVLFVCNAMNTARLTAVHAYGNTRHTSICSYAATCAGAIGIPMTTGDLHVSFIDATSRKIAEYGDDELIVSIPSTQIRTISESIEECVPSETFLRMEGQLRGRWKLRRDRSGPGAGGHAG